MKTISEIKKILKNQIERLRLDYGISELGIFGSYIKNLANENSDLDLLVNFQKPISLLKFIKIENELTDLLGIKVDLVMRSALKPRISAVILKEVELL